MAEPPPADLSDPRRGPGPRGWVLGSIAMAGAVSFVVLDLDLGGLVPTKGGLEVAGELFRHALSPAWTYEDPSLRGPLPAGVSPLPVAVLGAAWTTVRLASVALSLALVVGLVLGFTAASATWKDALSTESADGRAGLVGRAVQGWVRVVIALQRSTHELLWAVLLLAAFGLGELSLVAAIVIPYSGIFAKVFSEMLDEAPRDAALALRAAGASPAQAFFFGLLPRALPDLGAYAFYRFECALRSSAVLGFFGYPTLGYYISASFENLHYAEVWTFLYALVALVVLTDAWSGAIRRRWVA